MAAQAGLCLAWLEPPEDTFSHGEAHMYMELEEASNVSHISALLSGFACVFKGSLTAHNLKVPFLVSPLTFAFA